METVVINEPSMESHEQKTLNFASNFDSPIDTLNKIEESNDIDQELISEKVEKVQINIEKQSTVDSDELQTNLFGKEDNETIEIQSDILTKEQNPVENIFQQFQSTTADSKNRTENVNNDEQLNILGCLNSGIETMKSLVGCQQKVELVKPDKFLIESNQHIDDTKNQYISKKLDCSIEKEYSASSMSGLYAHSQINTKENNLNMTLFESKVYDDQKNTNTFSDMDINNCKSLSSEHDLLTKTATFERHGSNEDNDFCDADISFETKLKLPTVINNQETVWSGDKTTLSSDNSFQNKNTDNCFPLDPNDNHSEYVSLKITPSLSDKSLISSPPNDENCNNSELQDNEDSSSSFRSATTKRSVSSTSSSQQLVIDHSLDDTENAKLAPLKLSLKRKAGYNSGSQPTSKNIQIYASEKHDDLWNIPNQQKALLKNCISLLNISTVKSDEGFKQLHKSKNGCDTSNLTDVHHDTCDPQTKQNKLTTRFYKCVHCMTFHEEWNFFNHVRDQHNRFICFYCLRLFSTAERLSLHMENKHDLEQNHFNTAIVWSVTDSEEGRNLTCCMCQHVFQANESFVEHNCSEFLQPCDICEQRGRHTNQCKYNNGRNILKKRTKKKFFVPLESQMPPDKNIIPSFSEKESSNNAFTDFQNYADTLHRQRMFSNNDNNIIVDKFCQPKINEPENNENGLTIGLEPPIPKLVIPKIMLRVPKEYQKSVDAEFSYTDSEEFDEDELDEHNSTTQSVEDSTNIAEQSLPLFDVDTNSATETATEASVLNERSAQMSYENTGSQDTCEDSLGSTNANLTRILDEIERTKMEILQSKDEATNKQELIGHSNCKKNTGSVVDQIWSPTPPASPQSRGLTPRQTNCKIDFELSGIKNPSVPNLHNDPKNEISNVTDKNTEQIDNSICNDSKSCCDKNDETKEMSTEENSIIESHSDFNESPSKDAMLLNSSDNADQSTCIQLKNIDTMTSSSDTIEIANEDTLSVELQLDRPLDKFETVELIRLCLKSVYPMCLYCNHARRIAVNAKNLVLHLIAQHRFTATVDSITAEELQAETIVTKLKSFLCDLENEYLNSSSYCTIGVKEFTRQFNERVYECFQCRFVTSTHKELYMHNRRLHIKTAILCFMCRLNFYSFSEILCHICPGEPTKASIFDVKYRCCLCEMTNLPSPFRLMVHLRKKHFACDVCLEDCGDQSKLSSHVWKHKLHHLCYRCGIAYRNKQDITKHLYWKHGTESIKCKRCLQKRWRHVYHFCVPPTSFVCDECNLCFSKAMYLEVHKRIHSGDLRYPCTEEQCTEIFVSRRLLLKHISTHHGPVATDFPTAKKDLDTETIITQPDIDITLNKQKIDSEVDSEVHEKFSSDKKEHKPIEQEFDENSKTNDVNFRKKRRKNKNSKESLEDLNLIAPNLSESDSFDESDTDCKLNDKNSSLHLPKVVLSPLSESDEQATPKSQGFSKDVEFEENIPDIWKNLLKGNSSINTSYQEVELSSTKPVITAPDYQMPKVLHVCVSDHDYCTMFRPQTPTPSKFKGPSSKSSRKAVKSFRTSSMQNSDNLSSDFSSESSSSSDSSSCSCGSNCSCSSSDSESSSSSSSSNNSNLSTTSKTIRKRQRKKSMRKKSASPLKPLQTNSIDVDGVNVKVDKTNITVDPKSPPFNESDLETAESETDEEFYDEHPQKLANELLVQKRAALMAQTRLSPSHNFDIVENSRPSTPSLPDELSVFGEKRIKTKKKKRERKSTTKANQKTSATLDISISSPNTQDLLFPSQYVQTPQNEIIYDVHFARGHLSTTLPTYTTTRQSLHATATFSSESLGLNTEQILAPRPFAPLANLSIKHRSEGSSCSDMDATLKRSKRTRRPNKFYGYSSEDENMSSVLAPPLMVGMQLIKPQPPPQLTWAKEDLPAPSKSAGNHKNRASRISKTPTNLGSNMPYAGSFRKKSKRKSIIEENSEHKRKCHDKKTVFEDTTSLPPIPTLKIRSSQLLVVKSNNSDDSSETTSDDEVDNSVFEVTNCSTQIMSITDQMNETVAQKETSNVIEVPKTILPVPEATVFKQKIPPALLPNPDFATLQYFKANNIRYPIRPPAGARLAREGEAVYCYCRCPYDEVSEMIACDGENCLIEWFHFECVGIMLAPQGKWFCAECRPKYSEELYPTSKS